MRMIVTASNLNVRRGGEGGEVIGQFPRGTPLVIDAIRGNWARLDGERGPWAPADAWMCLSYLEGGYRTEQDIPQLLSQVRNMPGAEGLGPEVAAVLLVESNGSGFGTDGRLLIRFEVHKFERYSACAPEKVYKFFQRDSDKPWLEHRFRTNPIIPWSRVHRSQKSEYRALSVAADLDANAAYMSISMGAPQIMGFNHHRCGYRSARAMYDAFSSSTTAQFCALVSFLNPDMKRALLAHEWEYFATRYNGPGKAKDYGAKLQKAFEWVSLFDNADVPDSRL